MTGIPPVMAITGFSLRTPLGDDIESIANRMLAGERVVMPNARFDARTYPCKWAATIPTDPKPTKHRKFVKRMGLFGMEVGAEAFARSGASAQGSRLGLFCGYGGLRAHWDDLMPVLEHQDGSANATDAWARGFSSLHPFWMLFHLSNNAHALLSIQLGATGDGTTTAGSNAGAQALRAAITSLEIGAVDAAIVFAYDSLVEPETILSLGASGDATNATDASNIASPYDEYAAGFIPAEAAAAVVLERRDDAKNRAMGFVSAAIGADGNAGSPDASTLAQTLSNLAAGDTIVDGSSAASRIRDDDERNRIAEILSRETMLISTASSLGQTGAAAAVVQTIMLAHFLSKGILPPISSLSRIAPGPLHPLMQPTRIQARSALGLSCGMPGLAGAIRVETQ